MNTRPLMAAVLALGLAGCAPSGHTRVTAMRILSVGTPANLSDEPECVELRGNIAPYGVEMDRARIGLE